MARYWQPCALLKDEIFATAVELLHIPEECLKFKDRAIYNIECPSQSISLKEIAALWRKNGKPTRFTGEFDLSGTFPKRDPRYHYAGTFVSGAAIAQVQVDLKTGKSKVLKVVVAQDAGRAINPLDLEGQVEGAVVMELGSVLMEEHIPGQTLSFKSYPIPRAKDAPEVETILVETPGSFGPYGAKGVGEAIMGHTRAAILNALCDATGKRITQIPVTPARMLEVLRKS